MQIELLGKSKDQFFGADDLMLTKKKSKERAFTETPAMCHNCVFSHIFSYLNAVTLHGNR